MSWSSRAGAFLHTGYTVEGCMLTGFAEAHQGRSNKARKGGVGVLRDDGNVHQFAFEAHHHHAILDGKGYTLIGSKNFHYWVVAKERDGGTEKVSALRLDDEQERQRMRTSQLGIRKENTLL